jgi:hypothetical protein
LTETSTNRLKEAEQVFGRALPLIHAALLQQYGLPRTEAREIEECLREWFQAFVRRPGSPLTADLLKPHLFSMACHAGHVYWSGKPADETPKEGSVRRSLSLGPQRIAIELETSDEEQKNLDDQPEKEKD